MFTTDPYTGAEIAREHVAALQRQAAQARLVAELPGHTGGLRRAVAMMRGLLAAVAPVLGRNTVAPTP